MHRVLVLEKRVRREETIIGQGLFGVAAGVAMLFATVLLFYLRSLYGPLPLPVFLSLVVG